MGLMKNMFDYNKAGPGVDKNTPKKKGIALFFSILSEKFWKLIPLSLLYWVCSLPVVTIGLADAAMAYITRNYVREKPVMLGSDFFDTIKKNWKQALPVGLINLAVTAVLVFAMVFYYSAWNSGFFFKAGLVVAGCIFIVFTFLKFYINFLLVTFDLDLRSLYKNSLLLSSVGLKENLIISGSLLGVYALFLGLPFGIAYILEEALVPILFMVFTILFLPAIQALIVQFCVFPVVKKHMIDPYYEQHPEAKKDKKLLNLFEDEEEGEDPIFKDRGTQETATEPASTIPAQYSERDIRQMRRRNNNSDDDTI